MKNRAFTLIELLVVVLIIGILAAIAVPQYQKAVYKSRATQLITATKQLWDAQKSYYLQHGEYSLKAEDLDINFVNATGAYFHIKEDVYCMFSQYNHVYCYDQSMDVSIVQLYSGATQCYSYANQRGEDLCQNLAKSKDFQTGCGNSCHIYSIN